MQSTLRQTQVAERATGRWARRLTGRRSPALFIGLTVALAVPFWVLGAVTGGSGAGPVALPSSALQVFAPALAAVILVIHSDGFSGVRALAADAVRRRGLRGWRTVTAVIVVMPAIYGSAFLVMRLTGTPMPEPEIAWGSVPLIVAIFLAAAFFEEIGWTGYALAPLQARRGTLVAVLLIGFAWAAVHVIPDLQGGHDATWIAFHRSSTVFLRILIVAAYNATGGSLPAAIVVHAMDNISWMLFPNNGSHYDPVFVAPVAGVVAIGVLWRWHADGTGSRGR